MKSYIILFFVFCSLNLSAQTISLRSDLWCPYACDPKSSKPGFMVEIAREVFHPLGYKIDYQLLNWARALSEGKRGKFDGLIACGRDDVVGYGFAFPEIPTAELVNYFWTLPETSWMFSGEKSLESVKIGVINDYLYGPAVDLLMKKNHPSFKEVSGENPLLRLIQMTETKRITGFVENPNVLNYNLNKLKKKKDTFKIASANIVTDPDLYIAFSTKNKNGKLYAKILGEGMIELRKNGRLKEILAKYGLTDWKKK